MLQAQSNFFTPDEYLQLEEKSEDKHEYFQGEIFAMAGGSYNHNMIAGNFYAALHHFTASRPCTAFTSDMRLWIPQKQLYTYPDAMMVCGEPKFMQGRTDTITNPLLIVEVLSKSTQEYDRGLKFEAYRTIPSLQDYLMLDQDRVHLECFHKLADDRWVLTEIYTSEALIQLESHNFMVPVTDLYQRVDWFKK